MGLYEEVMQRANVRGKLADGRAKTVGESLAKLEMVTPAQLDEARARLQKLIKAGTELPGRLQALETLDKARVEARDAHASVARSLDLLRGVEIPRDLEALEEDRTTAAGALALAEAGLAAVLEEGKGMQSKIAEVPALTELEHFQRDHAERGKLADRRAGLDLESLIVQVDLAVADCDRAREALEAARIGHAAQDLRRGLVAGDPCPVCGTVIGALEEGEPDAHQAMDLLRDDLSRAEEAANLARGALKGAEGEAKQIDRQMADVMARLEPAPSPEMVEDLIAKVRALEESRVANEQRAMEAQTAVDAARATLDGLDERSAGLVEALLSARDRVAGEQPPLPAKDPIEAWHRFEEWLDETASRRSIELIALEAAREEADVALSTARDEQRTWLEGLGIVVTDVPGTDLALAEAGQRAAIDDMEKTIAQVAELEEELAVEKDRARVATALGNHLKSNNFEAWLLEEAMDVLIEGANGLLDDLSAGAYSLKMAKGQFEVIDHRNADLTRTTRSLSGGETFLVSLSLALSMADRLAELTGTSSRLESVFLDEGFGSLDQESLDVVASVLDELVGGGRTVGLVTHVPELADRIPVRFEVTKGADTAVITRVGE
jgi:exonuclease SbcC